MSNTFIGTNLGLEYTKEVGWTKGAASGATDMELRIADAVPWTRRELVIALQGLIYQLEQDSNVTATKFSFN